MSRAADRANWDHGVRIQLLEQDADASETRDLALEERLDKIYTRITALIGSVAVAVILLGINIALIATGVTK